MSFNITCLQCDAVFGYFCNLKKGIVETYQGPASIYKSVRNLDIKFDNNIPALYCSKCNNYIGFKNRNSYILLHQACRAPIGPLFG